MPPHRHLVLIAEDDPTVRELLAEALEFFEMDVLSAANGDEALRLLQPGSAPLPCVVLLDLLMPVMDGFELARRLRLDPALRRVPLIVCTATPEGQCTAAEADLLIQKPFDLDQLARGVDRLCRVRATLRSSK